MATVQFRRTNFRQYLCARCGHSFIAHNARMNDRCCDARCRCSEFVEPEHERVDLNKLSPATRARVERALSPRTQVFSSRFTPADITSWKHAAKSIGMSTTEWVEYNLNDAAMRIAALTKK